MPSVSLTALRRTFVVLLVLGVLFGAAPEALAVEGRTVDTAAVSVAPEPSNEAAPDAAEAVLPPQSGRVARPDRPSPDAVEQALRSGHPFPAPYAPTRRPTAATGLRCVVLRC
ncbi:hypothetical protein [Streptomyces sp. NBC_00083]|uniref:hypothetical protein n=1 Tax=Streptomyces sp. NBC_00083 TaxID=2975647 RepID=UPI002253688F|nr:hypothetical protein [Streptomyces sp. NBC_00083]MCX5386597.1 hypothetical protein [Streptomyces sp. NBC_00083]